jgi:hypothetical protein
MCCHLLNRLRERFNAHVGLKQNVEFVKNIVDLIDLLSEYRELKEESSDELKTFYLNEILVIVVPLSNIKRSIL